MFIQFDAVVICNLLQLIHPGFELTQVLLLTRLQLISLVNRVTQVIDLFLQECKALSAIVYGSSVLLGHLFRAFAQHLVHSAFALHLLVVKRQEKFLVVLHFLLCGPYVLLQVDQEVR